MKGVEVSNGAKSIVQMCWMFVGMARRMSWLLRAAWIPDELSGSA